MNILVVTTSAWRNDDNAGNTMTNFFCDDKKNDYYNLYFRSDIPDNSVIKSAFHISDQEIVKNVFRLKKIGNKEECKYSNQIKNASIIDSVYKNRRSKKGKFLWFIRDLLWFLNLNKTNLKQYLEQVKPDVVFFTASNYIYIYRIVHWIIKHYNYKFVSFYGDDNYLIREKKGLSYQIYYHFLRKFIKKNIELSDLNYCSSPIHSDAYSKEFNRPFLSLIKSRDFISRDEYSVNKDNIEFLYIGNLYYGRWKTLVALANTIKKINSELQTNHILTVFSANSLNDKVKEEFEKSGIQFMGKISPELVDGLQKKADILVYAESFYDSTAKYSFSTKIVDYLYAGRCIAALGSFELASIKFFKENNCAQVIDNPQHIYDNILELLNNDNLRSKLAVNAWNTGKNYCSKKANSQKMLEEINKLCQ
ncbi:Glycosyltransferase involved in cell wall bisynthesis [Eubacterium ruminantium]|uniref:Glycosyltransferase involved in cell wall bisynthesis n=1 Tax=Eubacterium ruminantium TaxID=42322 RepID=A0A1T4LSG5_9FIRM|nr:hypothetical protein [Eubacterium ruminantium]SCW40176.1 Glycosyltransferase involved in cell wall bisynthesis [Eubacterium ruminantium]SDM40231.1 Glycosyltransferase involved in cell wall bisynthesis [Eubacterium ruminantium]SJZ57404.1 Glycosyltransferase involved in cell wall bisynthesis [Eubacterium ruminantium]